jgi:hypothetical protein
MNNCIALADIDEAINCADIDNVGGLVQEIYIGYAEDVATWPKLPAPAGDSSTMSLADAGTWNGDIVQKTGKKFFKVVYTDETGTFTMTQQGEQGAESYLYQLDISRVKMNATIFGFENAIRGRKLVIIVKDKNGVCYLMGDSLNAAKMIAADASTTGTAVTDKNNVPLRFTYACPRKLVYDGDTVNILEEKTSGTAQP